jgi:hypothetical protein
MKIHWIGLAVVAGLIALALSVGHFGVGLVMLPLLAWYASRILVHGGFDLWHYARQGSKAEWNGRYYEFAGARLRAEEIEEGLVFVEDDILAIIAQPKSTTLKLFGPNERVMLSESKLLALTQAGCERLLLKCPHRDAKKLMLFLQREAFFPHAKRHGKASGGLAAAASKTTIVDKT